MRSAGSGACGLWIVDLDDPRALGDWELVQELSVDERDRAARLRPPENARRWARGRVALRRVLGDALGVAPLDVRYRVSDAGKPSLRGARVPHFSLSHSAGRALIGLSDLGEVGVDIERVRDSHFHEEIARRAFGPAGRDAWLAADPASRTEEFYRLWARFEAVVKCRGHGLVESMGRDFSPGLDVRDVVAGEGYVAAWASVGPGFAAAPTCFDWTAGP